jgi:KDO2-lipid IV(A) lauroyltransferase
LAWSILHLARVLPLAWGRGLCVGLARLALRVRPVERAQARANLQLALPEFSDAARESLLLATADHLGANLFHTLAAGRLLERPGFVVEEEDGPDGGLTISERLSELAAPGRGVLILTGHIGCWELAGGWVSRLLVGQGRPPLAVVTGSIHNPAVDRLLQSRRRALGLHALPRERGAGAVVRYLRAGGVVAVLQDQQTRVRNLMVPFMGAAAPTPVALAALALRYRIPVLPVVGIWDAAGGLLIMKHLPPIRPEAYAEDDQLGFLRTCNEALEVFVKRNPEQWVWFHRRWWPAGGPLPGTVTTTNRQANSGAGGDQTRLGPGRKE